MRMLLAIFAWVACSTPVLLMASQIDSVHESEGSQLKSSLSISNFLRIIAHRIEVIECLAQTNASFAAADALRTSSKLDNSKEGMCFMKCLLEKRNIMKENGFDIKLKETSEIYNIPEQRLNTVSLACSEKALKSEEKCHRAYTYVKCVRDIFRPEAARVG